MKRLDAVIPDEDMGIFLADLKALLRVVKGVDDEFSTSSIDFEKDFRYLEELVDRWNAKYPSLRAEVVRDSIKIGLKLLIPPASMSRIFLDIAIRIADIHSVNNYRISPISLVRGDYSEALDHITDDRMSVTYTKGGGIFHTIVFQRDLQRGMVELIFKDNDITDKDSPEFRVASYHALQGYNPAIDMRDYQEKVSFFKSIGETG